MDDDSSGENNATDDEWQAPKRLALHDSNIPRYKKEFLEMSLIGTIIIILLVKSEIEYLTSDKSAVALMQTLIQNFYHNVKIELSRLQAHVYQEPSLLSNYFFNS